MERVSNPEPRGSEKDALSTPPDPSGLTDWKLVTGLKYRIVMWVLLLLGYAFSHKNNASLQDFTTYAMPHQKQTAKMALDLMAFTTQDGVKTA